MGGRRYGEARGRLHYAVPGPVAGPSRDGAGAGTFVTTVVVGIIAISTGFTLTRRPFLRDILLYLGAVIYIFCMIVRLVGVAGQHACAGRVITA